MKFIMLFVLISTEVYSRDCLQEAYNFTMGEKVLGVVTDMVEVGNDCSDPVRSENWDAEVSEMSKFHLLRKAKLKDGRPIEKDEVYVANDDDPETVYSDDICRILDREIKKRSDCYRPESMYRDLTNTDFSRVKLKDLCLKLGPTIKASRNKCLKK